MKKSLIKVAILLIIGTLFLACDNPFFPGQRQDDGTSSGNRGGSGENFAVVRFITDGGTPQPLDLKVAWGGTIGRLRPVSKTGYGFLGWFDERGRPWDVETRPVLRQDDVNDDGFVTLTARWGSNIHRIIFDTTDSLEVTLLL
jgi:uncharacterized repeat protein (TIGR02543 family)